jgi:hypothetical protein
MGLTVSSKELILAVTVALAIIVAILSLPDKKNDKPCPF